MFPRFGTKIAATAVAVNTSVGVEDSTSPSAPWIQHGLQRVFYYIIALTAFVVIVAVVLPGMGIVGLLRPAIGDDPFCATFFEK